MGAVQTSSCIADQVCLPLSRGCGRCRRSWTCVVCQACLPSSVCMCLLVSENANMRQVDLTGSRLEPRNTCSCRTGTCGTCGTSSVQSLHVAGVPYAVPPVRFTHRKMGAAESSIDARMTRTKQRAGRQAACFGLLPPAVMEAHARLVHIHVCCVVGLMRRPAPYHSRDSVSHRSTTVSRLIPTPLVVTWRSTTTLGHMRRAWPNRRMVPSSGSHRPSTACVRPWLYSEFPCSTDAHYVVYIRQVPGGAYMLTAGPSGLDYQVPY